MHTFFAEKNLVIFMETQSAPLVGENLLLLGFYLGTPPGRSAHFTNFVALILSQDDLWTLES